MRERSLCRNRESDVRSERGLRAIDLQAINWRSVPRKQGGSAWGGPVVWGVEAVLVLSKTKRSKKTGSSSKEGYGGK